MIRQVKKIELESHIAIYQMNRIDYDQMDNNITRLLKCQNQNSRINHSWKIKRHITLTIEKIKKNSCN